MLRKFLLTALALMLFPMSALADLTGTWQADDGGIYYLREMNGMLHWYGEESANNPRWANVFHGRIHKGRISGQWMDVPKGRTTGYGDMELVIRDNGNVLDAVRKSGGFGGSHWTRVGYQPAPVQPMQPGMREGMREHRMPPAPPPMAQEDCIGFNPDNVSVQQINGSWKVVEGNHWMFDFGNSRDEANAAFRVIRTYRMNQSCFVGRPNPSFSYLLANGAAPSGGMRGEDCIGFNPNNISVQQINGSWKVVEGNHWMFDFGGNRGEAEQSAAIIRKYGFTQSCFVGRPNPSFNYMRR
ncbi:MAG TPA: hypothetical protein VNI58_01115 [Mariprofundaceae bacterium]|nr:hypothetical protein [Mariprofundaceae bacterium]